MPDLPALQAVSAAGLWIWPCIAAVGLLAGVMGGMLGIGGSIIMIPGLTLLLGPDQHLYQAAAMIANVAVAAPAALRHHRAGAMVPVALRWMLAGALVMVLAGVAASNLPVFAGKEGGIWLGRLLAGFLLYAAVVNIRRVLAGTDQHEMHDPARITRPRSLAVGGVMGTVAGLLGVGGGILAVPLQQVLLRLPLRSCIANSAAVMVVSAALGSAYKTATLATHQASPAGTLLLAAALAPTCILGGHLGANLTHRLPLRQVRIVFILLLLVFAWRMMALP